MPGYNVAGLLVESEVPLPGRVEAETDGRTGSVPDIEIRAGHFNLDCSAPSSRGPNWSVRNGRFELTIPELCRFSVNCGRLIEFSPLTQGVDVRHLSPFLMGTCFAALLHQREALALRAAAVDVDGRRLLLCGAPGCGVTTVAAALCRAGAIFAGDEMAAVSLAAEGRGPAIVPVGNCWQLWNDSIDRLGLQDRRREPVRPGFGKFLVEPDRRSGLEAELAGVFVIREQLPSWAADIRLMPPAAAAHALFNFLYCSRLVLAMGHQALHMAASMAIIRSVPVYQVTRPCGYDRLGTTVQQIFAHACSSPR